MNLSDDIHSLKGIGPKTAQTLSRLGIKKIYDLLTYYPRSYEDHRVLVPFQNLAAGQQVSTMGTILNVSERQAGYRRLSILTVTLGDGTGYLQACFFNQGFLKKNLLPGKRLFVCGKVEYAYGGRGMFSIRQVSGYQILGDNEEPRKLLGIFPIYVLSASLNQKFFRKEIKEIFAEKVDIPEILPEMVLQRYHLMSRAEAFQSIHFPREFPELKAARRRLAFEELYLIQCGLMWIKKQSYEHQTGVRHLGNGSLVRKIRNSLPFSLTHDQEKAWNAICRDMQQAAPMRRLLQGDVGSGKTVLTLLALVKTVENGFQGVLMAPTEVLAEQHYQSFLKILKDTEIRIGFLSGRLTEKKRKEMYEKIAAQEVDIVIGTHALLQEKVHFAQLGLAVTDEQHRFGISQRAELEKKGQVVPDVLVMTATPIPRTMTLTIYGDLDVSIIKELPPGRKPIRTFLRTSDRRPLIYRYVRQELEKGRQAYVVCPLIAMNESLDLPSAEEVYDELRFGIFRGIKVGLLHGKMKAAEKEAVMQDFYENKISLLVTTTVIEVGVNVPNASLMVIEHAERFGLAQLHQLRGRIGRGPYASFCILVSDSKTEDSRERLSVMAEVNDGFQLAEADLKLRGPGQFFGSHQHGLPDLKIADVEKDLDILLEARQAALDTFASQMDMSFLVPTLSLIYKKNFLKITDT